MKRIFVLVLVLVLMLMLTMNCTQETKTSDANARIQTEKLMAEAWRQIGLPNIVNFQQLKLFKKILEQCDREDLICHAYLFNSIEGKVGQYLGKCLGYGVPFSAQFTNPEKVVQGDHELGYDLAGYINYPMKLPQRDPNGLFMPTSSSATWLMLWDNKEEDFRPTYIEPEIIVSPFRLDK